jgi:hypothetical protein
MILVGEKRTLNSLYSDCRPKNKRREDIKKFPKWDRINQKVILEKKTYKLFF